MARTTGSNFYWPEDPARPDFFVEWPGLETQMSHRHFSHLCMLYPLGEIHRFSPYRLLRTARNTIHTLILRGSGGWAGFSFPWASLLATRAGWPLRMPFEMLEQFAHRVTVAFNGLSLNEDHRRLGVINQTGAFGPFHLENFSLESSLIAMTAVQDALLHAAGDHLVFAGGVPPECDGEFWGLRSPFGELVSGKIEGGKLMSAEVRCERTGPRQLALDTEAADWKVKGTCVNQAVVKIDVKDGETVFLKRK